MGQVENFALSLANVSKAYGRVRALENLSFSVAEGRFFVLFGPSSVGKTTTLRTIAGLVTPDRGRVEIFGKDWTHEPIAGRPGKEEIVAQLSTTPKVQGALIALDPSNGHLVSMVGGYDYGKSQFNRAVQSRRQIGSAIKPFIYAAAIEKGMTPLTVKWDAPVKLKSASGMWVVHNYKPEYLGAITLRTALAKSINTISAQLVAQLGVDAVVDMMRRLGITSKLPIAPSIAVGTADLGLEETAYALATFPTGDRLVSKVFITRLVDADGHVLEDHTRPAPGPQRLTPEVAYVVTDLMKGVVEVGTAKKAHELGRPAAGKTGTSTNYRDAWFYGFTPELLCGVWVGRDDFKPVGHDVTGGQVAVPIWLAYMREALRDVPVRDFQPPPGVLFVRADPETGVPAPPTNPKSRLIPFKRGTLPPGRGPAAVANAPGLLARSGHDEDPPARRPEDRRDRRHQGHRARDGPARA